MKIDRIALITEMAKQDISVKELSERSNVSRTTISALRGGKKGSSDTITKIAKALGKQPRDLCDNRPA